MGEQVLYEIIVGGKLLCVVEKHYSDLTRVSFKITAHNIFNIFHGDHGDSRLLSREQT